MTIEELLKETVGKSFRCRILVGTNIDGSAARTIEVSFKGDPNKDEDLGAGLKELGEMILAPSVPMPDWDLFPSGQMKFGGEDS